jgi:hypothetical protein
MLILTVLMGLASLLTEKVWKSTRREALADRRTQIFWAAQGGLEDARHALAAHYTDSHGWQDYLDSGVAQGYSATSVWSSTVNGIPVEIFIRDNPDGDDNASRDNDLKVFVLARARDAGGAEVLMEMLCGLDTSISGFDREGVQRRIDLSALPVATYGLAD